MENNVLVEMGTKQSLLRSVKKTYKFISSFNVINRVTESQTLNSDYHKNLTEKRKKPK